MWLTGDAPGAPLAFWEGVASLRSAPQVLIPRITRPFGRRSLATPPNYWRHRLPRVPAGRSERHRAAPDFAGSARGVARDDNLAPVRALRSHRQACRLLTERPPRGRFVVELRRYGGCRMSGRPNLMGLFSVKRDGSSRLRRAASSVCDLDCAHSRGVVYAAPRCFGRRDAALAERPSDRQERRLWRAGRPDVR